MVDFLTGEQRDSLIELYIAYFNRAPESGGLSFHADAVLEDLNAGLDFDAALNNRADNFFDAAIDLGVYSNAMTAEEFVATVYENTLLRPGVGGEAPSDADIAFWTARLESGEIGRGDLVTEFLDSIPFLLENGNAEEQETVAQVQAVLENRVEVAREFSKPENSGGLSGQEAIAAGKAAIANVDGTQESVDEAINDIEDGSVGQDGGTFTLTGEIDDLNGTPGDDTFQGAAGSIDAFDSVNGGAGDDTLNIIGDFDTDNSDFTGVSIESVETVNVTGNSDAFNASVFGADAVAIWQVDTAANISGLVAGQTAGFRGDANSATVTYESGVTEASVALDNMAEHTSGFELGITNADNDLETVNISGSVADTNSDDIAGLDVNLDATVETLNLAVESDIGLRIDGADASLTTLDASGSTGGIALDTSGAAANDLAIESAVYGSGDDTVVSNVVGFDAAAVSVETGEGNDDVTLYLQNADTATALSVDLGAGDDMLTLSAGSDSTTAAGSGNLTAAGDLDDLMNSLVTVSGFDTEGDDVLDLSGVSAGGRALQASVNSAVSGSDAEDLFEAASAAADAVGAGEYGLFEFEGNTYVYAENDASDNGLDAGDTLVELTGVDLEGLSVNDNLIA